MLTVFVGTGNLAYALANLWDINNSSSISGNTLEVTKAGVTESDKTFHETWSRSKKVSVEQILSFLPSPLRHSRPWFPIILCH
jgi:hypothetical protein